MSQRALIGGLTVVMLLTTATAVVVGLRHQKAVKLNEELLLRCEALRQESDARAQTLSSMAAQRATDQAELTRLRESSAATIATLRDQVSSLEKQAAGVQEQIKQAQAEGSVKEGRIAELAKQLEETQTSADRAQSQLKAMGFTKDELSDQVGKLQARLATADDSLRALREQSQQQIAALKTELDTTSATLTTTKDENFALAKSNQDLRTELSRRPKVSPFADGDTYKPARDRKARPPAR